MLQKSANAEGAKIGVILSILPFGSRPWNKLSWELHCLTFDGTNWSASKQSWGSVYPCMAQGTEDWMIYQQVGKHSYWPVYRSFRQCVLSEAKLVWNERVNEGCFSRCDCFLLSNSFLLWTTFGKHFPSSWLINTFLLNWLLNYLSKSEVCFLSEKFLVSRNTK